MSNPNDVLYGGVGDDLLTRRSKVIQQQVHSVPEASEMYFRARLKDLRTFNDLARSILLLRSHRGDQNDMCHKLAPEISAAMNRCRQHNDPDIALTLRAMIVHTREIDEHSERYTTGYEDATAAWIRSSRELESTESVLTEAVREALRRAGVSDVIIETAVIELKTLNSYLPIMVISSEEGNPFVAAVHHEDGRVELL